MAKDIAGSITAIQQGARASLVKVDESPRPSGTPRNGPGRGVAGRQGARRTVGRKEDQD